MGLGVGVVGWGRVGYGGDFSTELLISLILFGGHG